MRWSEQITLIAQTPPSEPTERTNEHGFPVPPAETATTIFANKKSVGYSEFYKAAQAGYTAEMKFDVRTYEYGGQEIVEYPVGSGKRYRVLRAYVHEGSHRNAQATNGEFTELTLVDLPEAPDAPDAEGGDDDGGI